MKSLIVLIGLTLSFANSASSVDKVNAQLDEVGHFLEKISNNDNERNAEIADVLNDLNQKERRLWTSIIATYDFLKLSDLKERYIFMYRAIEALTSESGKTEALKMWSKTVKSDIYRIGLNHRFYDTFRSRMAKVDSDILELEKGHRTLPAITSASQISPEILQKLKNSIQESQRLLKSVKTPAQLPAPVAKKQAPENHLGYAALTLLSMIVGVFLGKRKQTKSQFPQLSEKEIAAFDATETPKSTISSSGVSLEEKCEASLQENAHLFKVANLKVYPVMRSPFNTKVNAPEDKVEEALTYLLKGALAIANSTGKGNSHLEWSCKEQFGRVSLDLILHGIECDSKSLYQNVLIEKEASAPAHFGRTEMALNGHLPSVRVKSANQRTIISFGLESSPQTLSH